MHLAQSAMNPRIFSTCPQSSDYVRGTDFLRQVIDVAQWSEANGCEGILVYTDNRLVDPWLVSQIILQKTQHLAPLVAVQPVYMHPYSAAKMIATFGRLYGRRIHLNMVAGGFSNDLAQLGDPTPHDRRYERLVEYTEIIKGLLANKSVTLDGAFYQVKSLKLSPSLPESLFPEIFISGSSDAGMAAARAIGAVAVKYPKPPGEETPIPDAAGRPCGMRIGVIARMTDNAAWQAAEARFPEDRKGQITHELAMKTSDSLWHRQLSALAPPNGSGKSPYWMQPFQNYQTFCPYLVGSYERVGAELARYMLLGSETFILDIPRQEDDLRHARRAFDAAVDLAASTAGALYERPERTV